MSFPTGRRRLLLGFVAWHKSTISASLKIANLQTLGILWFTSAAMGEPNFECARSRSAIDDPCFCRYHQIAGWADFVNAHPLPGAGIVDGLKTAFEKAPKAGLLLLGQMSTKGNLITDAYTAATVDMAEANPDFVFGFISQKRLRNASGPDPFIYMTPGVKMEQGGDAMGQQ